VPDLGLQDVIALLRQKQRQGSVDAVLVAALGWRLVGFALGL
jgi:hypothetical protein